MRFWRHHHGLRAMLAAILLAAQAACTSWRVQQAEPTELLGKSSPESALLTLLDSSRVEVVSPALRSDSIVGYRKWSSSGLRGQSPLQGPEPGTVVTARDSIAIAVADVQSVAIRKRAPGKSIGLAFAILGGFVAAAAIACASDCYEMNLGGAIHDPEY